MIYIFSRKNTSSFEESGDDNQGTSTNSIAVFFYKILIKLYDKTIQFMCTLEIMKSNYYSIFKDYIL